MKSCPVANHESKRKRREVARRNLEKVNVKN